MTKNTTLSFRISEEEKEKISSYCEKQDISISMLIRQLLKQYLKEQGEEK